MAERYEKVFSLAPMLYISGSPVIIEAGALLKDNSNNSILAQLKFKSLSNKHIKALKIKIAPLDTVGHSLGENIDYAYLDLSINRNDSFGSKQPIPLPNNQTRAFDVCVVSVAFDDNSIIELKEQKWQSIPAQNELDLDDIETEFYYSTYNIKQKKMLIEYEDLWLCSCGNINHNEENNCNYCKNNRSVISNIDIEEIHNEAYYQKAYALSTFTETDDIIKANELFEKVINYKDAKEKFVSNEKRIKELSTKNRSKRIKKFILIILVIILIPLLTIVSKYAFVYKENKSNYNLAVEFYENKEYDKAIEILEDLYNFKDSSTLIENIKKTKNEEIYQKACELVDAENEDDAIELFKSLNDYKDSSEKISELVYKKACNLLDNGYGEEALKLFQDLDGYKDSNSKTIEAETLYYVYNFDYASSYEFAQLYFDSQISQLQTVSAKDFEKELTSKTWIVRNRYGHYVIGSSYNTKEDIYYAGEIIKFSKNGIAYISRTNNGKTEKSTKPWAIKGNSLYYHLFFDKKDSIKDTYKQSITKYTDGVYLLSQNSKCEFLLVDADSNTGKQLKNRFK